MTEQANKRTRNGVSKPVEPNETEQLKARIAELEAENEALAATGAGREAVTIQRTYDGPQWRFRCVGSGLKDKTEFTLPEAVIEAPDESEAKRLYALLEQQDGKLVQRSAPLDPSSLAIKVTCLDADKRRQHVKQQYDEKNVPEKLQPALV